MKARLGSQKLNQQILRYSQRMQSKIQKDKTKKDYKLKVEAELTHISEKDKLIFVAEQGPSVDKEISIFVRIICQSPIPKECDYLYVIRKFLTKKTKKIEMNTNPETTFTKLLQNKIQRECHKKFKLNRFPRIIWTQILSFCSYPTLAQMELVNKQFFTLINPQCDCVASNSYNYLRSKVLHSATRTDDFYYKCNNLWHREDDPVSKLDCLESKRIIMGIYAPKLVLKYLEVINSFCSKFRFETKIEQAKMFSIHLSIHDYICLRESQENSISLGDACFICANPLLCRSVSIIKATASQYGIRLITEPIYISSDPFDLDRFIAKTCKSISKRRNSAIKLLYDLKILLKLQGRLF